MAVSVKISQLLDGGNILSQDQIPIARGNETFKIPANQIVTNAQNVGSGPGQFFVNKVTATGAVAASSLQFRSLSGENGLEVVTRGNTLVISALGQNPVKTKIIGNGTTRTFALNSAASINVNNYRVDIDGVLQEPDVDYTISGSNIIFTTAPPLSGKVVVLTNNLVRAYDSIPNDESVTTAKIVNGAVTPNKLSGEQTGTAPVYGCRAWVNFNGANYTFDLGSNENRNTIRASGNINRIVRNNTGRYTVYFNTSMPSANYAITITTDSRYVAWYDTASVSSFNMYVSDLSGNFQDPINQSVMVIV